MMSDSISLFWESHPVVDALEILVVCSIGTWSHRFETKQTSVSIEGKDLEKYAAE